MACWTQTKAQNPVRFR